MKETFPPEAARPAKKDRKLGDEWRDWQGEIEEAGGDLATSPLLFLWLGGLALLLLLIGGGFFWYLIEPRMISWAPWLGPDTGWFLAALGAAAILWYAHLTGTVLTARSGQIRSLKPQAGGFLWPAVLWLGERFGYSKDRLRNSWLHVHNRLTLAWLKPVEGPLLVLVPRCLSKAAREEVAAVTAKYRVPFHTADGGNEARRLVAEQHPRAIVAVACERDLLSGVQDIEGRIPVLAVANKRPNGPCKATHLDRDELEEAIRFFMVPTK